MKIKTTYEIHQTVYFPNLREGSVHRFSVEKVRINIERRYSGEGGTIGDSVDQYYADAEGSGFIPSWRLFPTQALAQKEIEKYKKRFPTKICSECGSVVDVPPAGEKK